MTIRTIVIYFLRPIADNAYMKAAKHIAAAALVLASLAIGNGPQALPIECLAADHRIATTL